MKLQDLNLKQFLEKTASNAPVPGGGSVSAMHGATASALAEMLANLTTGRKNYEDVSDFMTAMAPKMANLRTAFIEDIDRDSEAYNLVMDAFKLPKDTDDLKAHRAQKIQEAMRVAAKVPMQVAERASEMLDHIIEITRKGNKNAVTDGCVAVMTCRTAILGALLNVRINLGAIKDEVFVKKLAEKCDVIEHATLAKEKELVNWVKTQL